MLRALLALAGLLLAGAAGPAAAQGIFEPLPSDLTESMVFKSANLHFAKIPAGNRNKILAWGGIKQGDAVRFGLALDAGKPVDEILLFSPGGSLGEGIEIGKMIRQGKFGTRIPNKMRCVSACNFIFMGGVVRTIDPDGTFEVHMFAGGPGPTRLENDLNHPPRSVSEYMKNHPNAKTLDPDKVAALIESYNHEHPDKPTTLERELRDMALDEDVKDIQQYSAGAAAEIADYLIKMRMSLEFLTAFADIPNNAPRPLTRKELEQFNVVNTPGD